MKIEVYKTAEETLRSMTETLITVIKKSKSKPFHIALSGGSTAQQLFKLWVKEYRNNIPWDILRFYWVDERCVSPEDDESNFKHAERLFSCLWIFLKITFIAFGENKNLKLKLNDIRKW